jgi:hypothetical protein
MADALARDPRCHMSEDTIILPAMPVKPPGLPLVPVLGGIAVVAAIGALVLFLQLGQRSEALAAATAQNAGLTADLARAKKQTTELENQLAARQIELESALMARLPVDVIFRVADTGLGFVAHFENHSPAALKLNVNPRRPSSGEYARLELTVPAQSSGDVNEKLGWIFRSGDTLSVSSGDFRPLSLQVP